MSEFRCCKPDCIAVATHEVHGGPDEVWDMCDAHWEALLAELEHYAGKYHALRDAGVNLKLAERRVAVEIDQDRARVTAAAQPQPQQPPEPPAAPDQKKVSE